MQSGFSDIIRRFLTKVGLYSVWEYFPVEYTHIHTDFKSTSVLDHFIVNERIRSVIEDCNVMHLGDNLSRHSPVMLKLNLEKLPLLDKRSHVTPLIPVWYKANQEEIDQYTHSRHSKLVGLDTPQSIYCSNIHLSLTSCHRSLRQRMIVSPLIAVKILRKILPKIVQMRKIFLVGVIMWSHIGRMPYFGI